VTFHAVGYCTLPNADARGSPIWDRSARLDTFCHGSRAAASRGLEAGQPDSGPPRSSDAVASHPSSLAEARVNTFPELSVSGPRFTSTASRTNG